MRKYIYIFKSELMSSINYVFNIFSRVVGYIFMMFVFVNLWKYIYMNPSEIINNYTMNQMIWYVIVTELLWYTLDGRKFCNKIINDVRSGNLVYNMNKPYNYINYLLFSHLGESSIKLAIYTIAGMTAGLVFLREIPALTIFSSLAVILTGILAVIINSLLIIFIGLFSFIVEDSSPFYWLYSKFMIVLGTIFPIEFFPKILQKFMSFSLIYAGSYGPARLFVNFNSSEFLSILIAQIIYIIIGYLLCFLVYQKGVRRLNVNGG